MFRKLRVHLTVVSMAVTGVVLIAMAAVSYSFSAGQLRGQHEERFVGSLNSIHYVLGLRRVITHAWLMEAEAAENVMIRVQSGSYSALFTGADPDRERITALAAAAAREDYGFDYLQQPTGAYSPDICVFRLDAQGGSYRAAVSRVPTEKGFLSVAIVKDMREEQAQIYGLLAVYTASALTACLCLLLFAWVFTGRAVRPIEASRRMQSEFVSAASHELRSPLTVMQVSAEGIQEADLDGARRYGEIIRRECTRLARLTGDLLRLAGADNRSLSVQPRPASPGAMVLNAVESYETLAAAKGITLLAALPDAPLPRVRWDPERIEQVLSILLDNALRFTPEGGKILARVDSKRRQVYLTVSDSGPGVPDGQKDRVFDRFYQGDASRTQREHFGLGLSIAREIVELHQGTIRVEDSRLGGAEFRVVLPAQPG